MSPSEGRGPELSQGGAVLATAPLTRRGPVVPRILRHATRAIGETQCRHSEVRCTSTLTMDETYTYPLQWQA
jgi:hypothetical protein